MRVSTGDSPWGPFVVCAAQIPRRPGSLTPSHAAASNGWRTVVGGGVTYAKPGSPSKPTTPTSSGTRRPASVSARITPTRWPARRRPPCRLRAPRLRRGGSRPEKRRVAQGHGRLPTRRDRFTLALTAGVPTILHVALVRATAIASIALAFTTRDGIGFDAIQCGPGQLQVVVH